MERKSSEYVKLIVRRLYDAQKLRIQSDLRLQRLVRDGIVLKETAETDFKDAIELERKIEQEYARIVWREIKDMEIVTVWLSRVKGIGPRLSGLLVALIGDIKRFPSAGKLWAYAGLNVRGGRAVKRAKGEKANWSNELKTTAFKIGESFIKQKNSPYRELYENNKQYLVARELARGNIIWKKEANAKHWQVAHCPLSMKAQDIEPLKASEVPEWSLGRIHNMARRRMVKIFLSHLWEVWTELECGEARKPYSIEKLGHTGYLDPWKFIENDEQKEEAA